MAQAEQRPVSLVFAGLGAGFGDVLGPDALAVDVSAKRDVTELGEHLGAFLLVSAQTGPLMHHQHAGALAGEGIIVGEIAFQGGVPLAIFNGFRVDGGAERTGGDHQQQGVNQFFHNALIHVR